MARSTTHIRGRTRWAAALVLTALAATSAFGQAEPASPASPASAAAGLATPRAAVTTFYDAMVSFVQNKEEERLEVALSAFPLEEFPEENRREAARQVAIHLYRILDALVFQFDAIPVEPEDDHVAVTLGDEDLRVTIELHRHEDGQWRFSHSRTLSRLDEVETAMLAATDDEAEDDAESDDGLPFDPRFDSPRATMSTFINSAVKWRETGMQDAIEAFDLSEIPDESLRRQRGYELSIQLMYVLNRVKYVRYTEIDPDPDGDRYVYWREPAGAIEMAIVADEEEGQRAWKFSQRTIDDLTHLYRAHAGEPPVPGVSDDLPEVTSLRIRRWAMVNAPFLLGETLYIENWQWLGLLAVILAGMAFSRVVAFLVLVLIRRACRRGNVELSTSLEKDFVRPIRVALMAWVWLLGLSVLGLPGEVLFYLRVVAKCVSAAAGVWAAYRLIDILGEFLATRAEGTENKFDDLLVPFITRGLKVFTVAFGVVFVAETFGYNYRSLLAGLGIGGLAVALAAKETIANIFGSLTILLDRPFQIGDWVRVNDVDGNVETVGMRSTRIRTFYNSLISVPNSELMNATIDNMGARRYRRIKTTLAVAYDTPPDKIDAFCEGIRELIRQHPYTRKDYFHVYLNEFGASSLDILLYCFHETPDWSTELRERHRLFNDIIRLAKRLGVEFAFPTQTLYLRQEEKPDHGPPNPPEVLRPESGSHRRGRRTAREILADTIQRGATPPPVSFLPPEDPDDPVEQHKGGNEV